MKTKVKLVTNTSEGCQFEIGNVLVTIRKNQHHGIAGSITVKENGKMILTPFHGQSENVPFPVDVHEPEVM